MSGFLRPRNLAIGGGVLAAVMLFPRTQKKAAEVSPVGRDPSNVFNTPATQSIGERVSAAGGTSTHIPAVATPKGKVDDTTTPHEQKGAGTAHFDRNHNDQKPGDPGAVGKAFHQAHLGNDKGK